MMNIHLATLYGVLLLSLITMSSTLDIVTPNQPIRDGNQTLISTNGTFEAGFFTPAEYLKNRYFGIWYKNISPRTVVWVANREKPLSDNSGVLEVDHEGNLRIMDANKGVEIWSSNASSKPANNSVVVVVQLLESGNMVVKDGEELLWESFDYPGDTLLPGMKIGTNFKTGKTWSLTCWKSYQDPTPGDFSFHIDTNGLPQLVITKEGRPFFRPGSWNGVSIIGIPGEEKDQLVRSSFVMTKEEVSYEIKLINSSIILRSRLIPKGLQVRLIWSNEMGWVAKIPGPADQCEQYALCGANYICEAKGSLHCECLIGFKADSTRNISGCVRIRNTTQECKKGNRDSFHIYEGMKLPDTSSSWYDNTISLKECEKLCLKNCSCTAYAKLNVSGTVSGCLQWFSDIVDMRKLPGGGQDFYLRVTAASKPASKPDGHFKKKKLIIILVGCGVFIICIILFGLLLFYIKKKWFMQPESIDKKDDDIDLPTFDFLIISNVTNHFSQSNILGQGGFGPVYKGRLADGQEIAVKRLSRTSKQGLEEFKNEVMLIAKLQHRNLVKLLGCSIHQEEKLLIYEFMPNGSLDYFLFDSTRRKLLGWAMRFEIVDGIARGLLYLHRDSWLKIIHRDLKASNILLDSNMEPKISDFGMARTFDLDQDEASTSRMAWKLWTENRPTEVIDDILEDDPTSVSEILRYIHIGLFCVQQRPEDRPDMPTVVLMLNGENILPEPSQPGFYIAENLSIQEHSVGSGDVYSVNEISDSLEGR